MQQLLAVDWGTSSLRVARLGADGSVQEVRAFERGVLKVTPGEFAAVFQAHFGDWMAAPDSLCLISGMAGSRQGWVEAPYCKCPAGLHDLTQQLTWVPHEGSRRVAIVPGLSCEVAGVPEVMRGEEVQVFGGMQLLGMHDGLLVLPGTHSKWVRVRGGRIEFFSTVMTGEFYALLREHSILARTLPLADDELDTAAFDQGVALALRGTSLLRTAFSVRTLALFERMPANLLSSYLSGLVIGEELRSQSFDGDWQVVLIGSGALAQRYERALARRGVSVRSVGAEATWRGLWAVAQSVDRA
jgi:2-dehydro-3-deoxygalactonokinase